MHSINGATVVFNDIYSNPFSGSNVTTTSNNDVFVNGDFFVEGESTFKTNANVKGILTM